ncbi:MAG: hypothetical protein P1Q69_18740 [Candidatus Thorarchaeota archaeon]|nr:hypothetical protein [Candidatus Thorarchaeota archaeon]
MFNEDDNIDIYDEDEADNTFPDEEDMEEESRSYDDLIKEPSSFSDDPWPPTVFILILIGFGFVLLTPPIIWSSWNYYLVLTYGLLVLSAISSVISLGVWNNTQGSRLRFGGLTNLIVVLICGVLGTVDALLMVTTGDSIIPGSGGILLLAVVIVLFSLYSLWLIQRTFNVDQS